MKGALVLLSSLLSMAASQGPMGMNRIPFHHHAIAAVEKATFGTFGQPMKFDCNVLSCSWADNVVHEDWMFYGAGWGNPEAMDPTICAKRCALDINCGAFEYVVDEHKNTNYCSWWRVGSCGFDRGSFIGDLTRLDPEIAETCSKVPVLAVECKTIKGKGKTTDAKPNLDCVFPFWFKGTVYDSCTTVEEDAPWCSTEVDSDGHHVGGEWGFCPKKKYCKAGEESGEESDEEFEGETGFNPEESGESGQNFKSNGGESGESGQDFEINDEVRLF